MNLVHTPHPISLRSVLILPSHIRPGVPSVSFLQVFLPKPYMHSSSLPCVHMPWPSHPPWLDHCNYIWRGVKVTKLFVMQFSPVSYYFIPLGPCIVLSTPFSNTLSICSSLNVRDQVSHPYKTTGNIIKISIFHDITPWSTLKVNRRLGRTCHLYLQGRRGSQSRSR
jgi:hypothetical protein